MTEALSLKVSEEIIDGEYRRYTRIHDKDGNVEVDIFHQSKWMKSIEASPCLDGHIFALLIYLMKRGLPVYVAGAVSSQALRNLRELQLAWTRWKPETYSVIEIVPASIYTPAKSNEGRTISGFSGGADATFTALMHTKVLSEVERYPLTDILMVHGFDVDLDNEKYFVDLQDRVQPLISDLGLQLRTIKTNSKDWNRQNWDDSFALELAACLHLAGSDCDFGLVGSSEPYEALVLPWGSSPVTDYLISGGAMQIVHDGAGYSRSDKIAEIAKHPVARNTIKVCWAGEVQSDNCGKCEKCIRTMLNFKANGDSIPHGAFPNGLNLGDIANIKIYTKVQMAEFEGIIRHAKMNGVTQAEWIPALKKRMRRGYSSYGPTGLRKLAGKTLDAVGLKQLVKRMLGRSKAVPAS